MAPKGITGMEPEKQDIKMLRGTETPPSVLNVYSYFIESSTASYGICH